MQERTAPTKLCERCSRDFTGERTHPILVNGTPRKPVYELVCPTCYDAELAASARFQSELHDLLSAAQPEIYSDAYAAAMSEWRNAQRSSAGAAAH